MSEITGFNMFYAYMITKHFHFGKGKYDLTAAKLPKRDRFLKQWNDKRRNTDGVLFYRLEKAYPKSLIQMVRLFAFYWLENQDFYITDIFNNNLETMKKYNHELRNIKDIFRKDFVNILMFCKKNNINIKKIFYSDNGFPLIIKMFFQGKISVHSLIIFNIAFGFFEKIELDNLNIVDKEHVEYLHKIFNHYHNLIKEVLAEHDWKVVIKEIISDINEK